MMARQEAGLHKRKLAQGLYSLRTQKWELENNSKQPTINRRSDSLKKSQLTLFHGVDEGGNGVNEDDVEWEPIKVIKGPCDSDTPVMGYGGGGWFTPPSGQFMIK
jgi:hypothetical protein